VASRVGGTPEVIEDGVTGRLVPPGDPAALADALEALHRKPDRARQMGLAGADRVRAEFTWGRVVESFESVYDEVMGLASFAPGEPAESRRGGTESRRGGAESRRGGAESRRGLE
jgi:hypothetical protein